MPALSPCRQGQRLACGQRLQLTCRTDLSRESAAAARDRTLAPAVAPASVQPHPTARRCSQGPIWRSQPSAPLLPTTTAPARGRARVRGGSPPDTAAAAGPRVAPGAPAAPTQGPRQLSWCVPAGCGRQAGSGERDAAAAEMPLPGDGARPHHAVAAAAPHSHRHGVAPPLCSRTRLPPPPPPRRAGASRGGPRHRGRRSVPPAARPRPPRPRREVRGRSSLRPRARRGRQRLAARGGLAAGPLARRSFSRRGRWRA